MSSPEHQPLGDPCSKCGADAYRHRTRKRIRSDYQLAYDRRRERTRPQRQDRIIGIDGEGQGRGPHIYNFLAAVDESGVSWTIGEKKGLRAKQIFEFLLSLPDRSLVVG